MAQPASVAPGKAAYVKARQIPVDDRHAIDVFMHSQSGKLYYFPLYSRTGRSWANYRSGGAFLYFTREEHAHNHIKRRGRN